jgi:hypothetical protein
MAREATNQMAENAPMVLKKFWASMGRLLDDDDPKALQIAAQAFNYTKAPGGMTMINTQLAKVDAPGAQTQHRTFESIVGMLETVDESRRLAIAQPEEEILDGDPDDEEEDE